MLTSPAGVGGTGNIISDPNFLDPYFNDIQTASEPAEGGNFIDVNYRYLTKAAGDYHIALTSPAVGQASGNMFGIDELSRDIDNDERPFNSDPDIGADETTEEILIINGVLSVLI